MRGGPFLYFSSAYKRYKNGNINKIMHIHSLSLLPMKCLEIHCYKVTHLYGTYSDASQRHSSSLSLWKSAVQKLHSEILKCKQILLRKYKSNLINEYDYQTLIMFYFTKSKQLGYGPQGT